MISAIVPTIGRLDSLNALLESLATQTCRVDEVIVASADQETCDFIDNARWDAVGLVTFDERIAEYVPARYRPGHLHRLMLCLERAVAGVACLGGRLLERRRTAFTRASSSRGLNGFKA